MKREDVEKQYDDSKGRKVQFQHYCEVQDRVSISVLVVVRGRQREKPQMK